MSIEFTCENCDRTLRVPDGSSGKRSQCPACGWSQEVPYIAQTTHPAKSAAPSQSSQTRPRAADATQVRAGVTTAGVTTAANDPPASAAGEKDGRLSIPCPNCKHLLVCSPELLGTRGQCRQCQHIFTITTQPHSEPGAAQPAALVFSCPKCNQLFEGKAEMEGRSGKCHVCHAVFEISLRPATVAATHELPASVTTTSAPRNSAAQQPSEIAAKQSHGSRANRARSAVHRPNPPATRPPIQFICAHCQGLMEVPGSAAGLDTACPYCQTVQTIPSASVPARPRAPAAVPTVTAAAAPADDLFASLGSPLDPFGGNNPYAVSPQLAGSTVWQPTATAHPAGGLTFGNVFSTALAGLFPTCLVTFLHVLVMIGGFILAGIVLAVVGAIIAALQPEPTLRIGVTIAMFVVLAPFGLAMGAWFTSSVQHMALRAIRKREFDFNKAFSPGGAFNVAFLVSGGQMVLQLLANVLPMLEGVAPGRFTAFVIPSAIVIAILIVLYLLTTSLASFAAVDGDGVGESFATSARLVFTNLPIMVGVKVLVWIMTLVLIIPTLGLALTLPYYFNATLYHLARKAE